MWNTTGYIYNSRTWCSPCSEVVKIETDKTDLKKVDDKCKGTVKLTLAKLQKRSPDFSRGPHMSNFAQKSQRVTNRNTSYQLNPITSPGFHLNLTESVPKSCAPN